MRTNLNRVIPISVKGGDVRSIMAYSHWLVMKAQTAGNLRFDGHAATEEEKLVAEQCRTLCDKISRLIALGKETDIPYLLECYDIAYRIGNRSMPDSGFINRHKHRVVKAWEAGDRKLEESSVFGMIASDVSYHSERADREYYKVYISIKEKWIAALMKNDSFPDVTSYENYQRLSMIMRENLDKEFGNKADEAKRRWYEHNRVENLSTLSSTILRSYRRFAGSLYPAVMDFDEKMALDYKILEELSARQDLNPYDREAFRMALEFNREMVAE